MNQSKQIFRDTFGTEPTESVTDKFLMDTILGIRTGEERKPSVDQYKKTTIDQIVNHYSKLNPNGDQQ